MRLNLLTPALLGIALGSGAWARTAPVNAPGTQVGALDFVEGSVFLGVRKLDAGGGRLPVMKEGDTLRTERGRAELLLTPGVFLRLDENSEASLVSAGIADTRVDLTRGAAILECDQLLKENSLALRTGPARVQVLKTGLYRFNADAPSVAVIKGQAEVEDGHENIKLGSHQMLAMNDSARRSKIPAGLEDDFDRWSRLRSHYIAGANETAATTIVQYENRWMYPNWYWDPYLATYTWVPARGVFINPYGYSFWSPLTVYRVYRPPIGWHRSGFVRTGPPTHALAPLHHFAAPSRH